MSDFKRIKSDTKDYEEDDGIIFDLLFYKVVEEVENRLGIKHIESIKRPDYM